MLSNPERVLALSVIELALRELTDRLSENARVRRKAAIEWFRDDVGAVEFWCECAELNPQAIFDEAARRLRVANFPGELVDAIHRNGLKVAAA